ncbi:MAG: DNA-J related domain-containing protein [Spongiibacteraceae bacterium]|nr:DNA-J related domain-containing protein [Spongiibacteraceae bacterium]
MSEHETPNPLAGPILDALQRYPLGASEYQLLQEIAEALPPLAEDPTLALFQKHFLVMNALYRLQLSLWEEGFHLTITPLLIRLEPASEATGGTSSPAIAADQALRDYYLDWNQFRQADRPTVDALLASFWHRFHATDAVAAALQTLALDAAADWQSVQQRYRQLAGASHPDRGGDPARFLEVRAAYEQLRAHFAR